MAGILGLTFYRASFFTKQGEYSGSKTIKASWWAIPKQKFRHEKRTYIYDSTVSRTCMTPFPYLFDYETINYTVGNPHPIDIVEGYAIPNINADDLDTILESDTLQKLNNVRKGGLADLLTWRNLMILIIVLIAVYYFSSGGSIQGLTSPPSQTSEFRTVETAQPPDPLQQQQLIGGGVTSNDGRAS